VTKSSFSRRALAIVAASTFALSACGSNSPIASANDAFVINGTPYSLKTFETLLADLVKSGQLQPGPNGVANKEDAISVMRTLIRYETYKQYLAANNLTETSSDRATIERDASASDGFSDFPTYLQELLINLNVAQVTIEKFKAYPDSKLKDLYNESPASTGVLCISHILSKTEDDAKKVLKELSDGAKFEDVAKKRSIEPAAKQSGGSLSEDSNPCTSLAFFQQQFDPDFMTGAVKAKAGVPTGPVKTQFGYHIILSHPYDTIKESLIEVASEKPNESNLVGYLVASDISVNPTFGVWNGAMFTIS
jgi:hypothetical protein